MCASSDASRANDTRTSGRGIKSGDDFFLKLSPTPICEKKKKKREIISKIVGGTTIIVPRSGIFFSPFFIVPYVRISKMEIETSQRRNDNLEDENFVHRSSFFFFYNFKKKNHLISKFRNSMCDENREGELGGDRNYRRIFGCFCRFVKF